MSRGHLVGYFLSDVRLDEDSNTAYTYYEFEPVSAVESLAHLLVTSEPAAPSPPNYSKLNHARWVGEEWNARHEIRE